MNTRINLFLVLAAAFVVILGAYTRLTHSGLGCPDWPGCYGQLIVPSDVPHDPSFTASKAWAEMIHRYAAGLLGLGIIAWALYQWRVSQRAHPELLIMCILVVVQAAFGAFTVTWKLHPLAVMPHLIGGITLTCLLWYHYLKGPTDHMDRRFRLIWGIAFACLIIQCICGGWTSANYAALICPDFPSCQGIHFPNIHFDLATDLQLPIGLNHEGGRLSMAARVSIHMLHRYMGLITGIVCMLFFIKTWLDTAHKQIKKALLIAGATLIAQATFGFLNIYWILPLSVATAHNGMALASLLAFIYLYHQVRIYHEHH